MWGDFTKAVVKYVRRRLRQVNKIAGAENAVGWVVGIKAAGRQESSAGTEKHNYRKIAARSLSFSPSNPLFSTGFGNRKVYAM